MYNCTAINLKFIYVIILTKVPEEKRWKKKN